jgi:hypothetical protein
MQIGHNASTETQGLSNTGKKRPVGNVSRVADTMNITPGGAPVKPVFEICAQVRQRTQTLGMVEIHDKQAGPGVNGQET